MHAMFLAVSLFAAVGAGGGEPDTRAEVQGLLGHWRLDPQRSDPLQRIAERLGVPWWKRALAPSRVDQEVTLEGATLRIQTQGRATRSERLPLDGSTAVIVDIGGRSATVRAKVEGKVLVLRGTLDRGDRVEPLESRRWVEGGDTYVVTTFGEGHDALRFTRVFVRVPKSADD